ncbi:hypothetical protein V2G26_019864 [Clonostachys chloroleuca]
MTIRDDQNRQHRSLWTDLDAFDEAEKQRKRKLLELSVVKVLARLHQEPSQSQNQLVSTSSLDFLTSQPSDVRYGARPALPGADYAHPGYGPALPPPPGRHYRDARRSLPDPDGQYYNAQPEYDEYDAHHEEYEPAPPLRHTPTHREQLLLANSPYVTSRSARSSKRTP